jgi:hypothetical protein
MTADDMRKAGWRWTKKGWTRRPRRLASVKARPMPPKKKPCKIRRVHEIDKPTAKPVFLTVEQGRADSAPTPAPESVTPAPREYAQLNDLTKQLKRPTARRRGKNAINPSWLKRKTGRTEPTKRAFHGKYDDLVPKEPPA